MLCSTSGRWLGFGDLDIESTLIDRLTVASDAPRLKGGALNRARMPGHARAWLGVAWGDIKAGLPDEHSTQAAMTLTVMADFKRDLLTVLCQLVERVGVGEIGARMSLLAQLDRLCRSRPRRWWQLGSYNLWGKRADDVFLIALHPTLAAQVPRPVPSIANLEHERGELTEMARQCGLAAKGDNRVRCGGIEFRATILDSKPFAEMGLLSGFGPEHDSSLAEDLAEKMADFRH